MQLTNGLQAPEGEPGAVISDQRKREYGRELETTEGRIAPESVVNAVMLGGQQMRNPKRSLREALRFDKTSIVGLVLLVSSFFVGALLRNSAYITDDARRRFLTSCDTYLKGLCIPTAYFSFPIGPLGTFVINVTSAVVSAAFFILGVLLVRK